MFLQIAIVKLVIKASPALARVSHWTKTPFSKVAANKDCPVQQQTLITLTKKRKIIAAAAKLLKQARLPLKTQPTQPFSNPSRQALKDVVENALEGEGGGTDKDNIKALLKDEKNKKGGIAAKPFKVKDSLIKDLVNLAN